MHQIETQIDEDEKLTKKSNEDLKKKEARQQDLLAEVSDIEEQLGQADPDETIIQKLTVKQSKLDQLTQEIDQHYANMDTDSSQSKLMEKQREVQADLESKKAEVEGLEEEIKQLNEQAKSPYSQAEQTRLQLLSELGEKRNQIQSQLTELRANEGVATEQDTIHVVTATKSGILHYLQPLSIGMSLQQNQIVGEIATDEEGFYVDSYIQAQDRSKVEVGQPVNVAVVGVNNYRFGTISGTVEFIEPGTIQNETAEGVISFYRARVSLGEDLLTSKSGEIIELMRSMPTEARIIYQEESYLEWLLDLLNLRSN